MKLKQSDIFNQNRFFWKLFGLWPGRTPKKFYKYFSFIFLTITVIAYNVLLTLNLYYTPQKINLLIREVIFYFPEIAVSSKVYVILFKRKKLLAIFDLLDCEYFQGHDDTGRILLKQHNSYFKIYLKIYTIVLTFTYVSIVFFPLFDLLFDVKNLEFPVCHYYFLSNETRSDYFVYIFIYQSVCLYGHVMYNMNIDTLIVGFLILAIAQVTVLEHDLRNLKIEKGEASRKEELDDRQTDKLRKCINHYKLLLRYCRGFEDIIDVAIFVQYGVGSVVICFTICSFLLLPKVDTFMVGYFFAMSLQIFVPAWLGTQLKYKSEELMVAVYKSDWIPRSKRYRKSVLLFVERAKIPIVVSGLKIFPLALTTYISIVKFSYSCFTLVRSVQDRQEH